MTSSDARPGPLRRSAVLAALLSALIPGLGQLWAGAPRRALIVALPFLIALALGVLAAWSTIDRGGSVDALAGLLLQPEVLAAVLVGNVVALVYRLAVIVDAWLVARRAGRGRGQPIVTAVSVVLLVVILAGNVAAHAGFAYLDTELASVSETILAGDDPTDSLLPPDDPALPDDALAGPDLPVAEPKPSTEAVVDQPRRTTRPRTAAPSPDAAPPAPPPNWSRNGRLDVLLLGVDAGPGRWSLRTDTMILVSVDVRTGRAAMFGIPRNMVNVPLPKESRRAFSDGRYPRLLNSLYVYAMGHPSSFPGGSNRGFRAVAGAIETLTGVNLDGMAIVDLNGFVKLVNALGGLRITVPRAIHDERYPKPDGSGTTEIFIKAGRQKMNGATALAYARSRHESSDYSRMRRQQEVLLALRKQVKPCTVLRDLPRLLKALKGTVKTTFKPEALPDLIRLAAQMDLDHVSRYSLAPPTYPEYLSRSDAKRIRSLVVHVFDKARAQAAKASPQPVDPGLPIAPAEPADDDPCA